MDRCWTLVNAVINFRIPENSGNLQAEEIVVCQHVLCSTDIIYENSNGSVIDADGYHL